MYNLKNVKYIKDIVKDKNNSTKIHTVALYKEFIMWLELQDKLIVKDNNNFTNLNKKDFQRFMYECGNISSYQSIVVKANNMNYIFKELGLDVNLNTMKPSEIKKDLNEIWDKNEILGICRNLINPQDQVIIYGLFSNISIEDLRLLKIENINLEKKEIYLPVSSKVVKIDDEFAIFIDYCINTDVYWKLGDATDGQTNPYYNLDVNSPYLLKPKPQTKVGYKNHFTVSGIRTRVFNISKNFEQYNIVISPKRLQISGLLYKLYEIQNEQNITWTNKTLTEYKNEHKIRGFVPELLISYNQKYIKN